MKKHLFVRASVILFVAVVVSCGGSSEPERAEETTEDAPPASTPTEAAKNMEEAMKEMTKAMGSNENVEPVDFRELKALLPEELAGMKRTNSSGQKTGAMGFKVSTAEGKYRRDGGSGNLTVSIADLGTLKGMAMMSYAAWLNMSLDRETDTGYERTTKYQGYPAMEKFEQSGTPRGEIAVAVGERFIVNVKGSGLEMDDLKEALGQIDLDKLGDMK